VAYFPHKPQGTPGTLTFEELKQQYPDLAAAFEAYAQQFLDRPDQYPPECIAQMTPDGLRAHWTFEQQEHGVWEADPNAVWEDAPPVYYSPVSKQWMDDNHPQYADEVEPLL
jgi:hypothetical protein